MSTPVPSSKPALIDVRGAMSMCQWKPSWTPRGAVRTQRLRSGCRRAARPAARSAVAKHRRAGRVLGEAGRLGAGDDAQLEGRARRPGADQRRLVVDRHQPLPAPHLLDQDVAEQPAARRPFAVGAGPLALAGDRRRHEGQRVELGVGVLERGAGAAALVDDQLHVGARRRGRASARARSRPRPRPARRRARRAPSRAGARGRSPRGRPSPAATRRGRARRPGARRAAGRRRWRRRRLRPPSPPDRSSPRRSRRLAVPGRAPQRRIEVRHDARLPAGGVRIAAARPHRVDLRRRLLLAPLAEGAALGLAAALGVGAAELVGAARRGPARGSSAAL